MLMSRTWEQTAVYNPNDPEQLERVAWTNPGGFNTFYFNRVKDAGVLNGLGNGFSSLPQPVQIGVVTLAAAVAGFFAYAKLGHKVKPALKRIGLAGARRRR